MAKVFIEELDLHDESAKGIFNTSSPTKDERYVGKTTNFLTVYGGGAKKLASTLDVSEYRAREILSAFHKTWPGVKKLSRYAQSVAIDRGYVKTLLGRQLRPEEGKEYTALNTIIQGSAAEILKMAMVKVHKWLQEGEYDSHMVLSIHDEIGIDATIAELSDIVTNLPSLMRYEPVDRYVPLDVDINLAQPTWYDKMPVKEFEERNKITIIGRGEPT